MNSRNPSDNILVEFKEEFLIDQEPGDIEDALEFLKSKDPETLRNSSTPNTGDRLSHCLVRARSVILCEKLLKLDPSLIDVTETNSQNLTALELSLSLGFSDMFGLLSGHINASISDINENLIAPNAERELNFGQLACIFLIMISRSVDQNE